MARALTSLASIVVAVCTAEQVFLPGATGILAALDDLSTGGRVLMIAAHPDDETNSTLAYLARGRHLRTAYLSLTRGEGGQNAIGSEQGALLGIIRTQELLAARRIDGARQSFTSAVDFGYSKTAEETLHKWNREQVLGDIVARIRVFRPEIVIHRWSGTTEDGHGQHQASGILGREAVKAAADASRFPHAGPAWQVKQEFAYSRRKQPNSIVIPVSQYNPVLGYTYSELGALSRSQHHSQGMGTAPTRGPAEEYLIPLDKGAAKLVITEAPEKVLHLIATAKTQFHPDNPEEIIPILKSIKREGWRVEDVDELIAQCAGVKAAVLSPMPYARPGQELALRVEAQGDSKLAWKAKAADQNVTVDVEVAGEKARLARPVVYRYTDKVIGERIRPVAITPALGVSFSDPTFLFRDESPKEVRVVVKSFAGAQRGSVSLKLMAGWTSNPDSQPFQLASQGAEVTVRFRVTPPKQASVFEASALLNGSRAENVVVIDYPHIPAQTVTLPATAKFVRANVRLLAKKVGYVMGAGDTVPDAIRQMGGDVVLLAPDELSAGDLDQYDVILTGVRAFNVREDLRANIGRLNDYVRQGGTLVVQYNTKDDAIGQVGPYPIEIGNSRVSVEESPVRIIKPDSVILRGPNPITPADFDGWIQERGLYFPSKWDAHYETVIASNDPGDPSLQGGILFARYGEGAYIYTSYSWFRQLPAGVPGAFRLFANLLSQ